VGLQHITKGKLEALHIPLPPLAEQHRIVAKVDELMAICDQLEQQLNAGEQLSRRLLEAVLQEALVGGKQGSETVLATSMGSVD
jgi:type I restriction enzyme S subunit